jgi:hypothetical protein
MKSSGGSCGTRGEAEAIDLDTLLFRHSLMRTAIRSGRLFPGGRWSVGGFSFSTGNGCGGSGGLSFGFGVAGGKTVRSPRGWPPRGRGFWGCFWSVAGFRALSLPYGLPQGESHQSRGLRLRLGCGVGVIRLGFGSGLGFGADPFGGVPLTDVICKAQAIREGEDTKPPLWCADAQ